MMRSTLPSIKAKQYINKTKARLENEHLQEFVSCFSVLVIEYAIHILIQ